MNPNKIIVLSNITKKFFIGQPNELTVLKGIDVTINQGEFVKPGSYIYVVKVKLPSGKVLEKSGLTTLCKMDFVAPLTPRGLQRQNASKVPR